MKETKLISLLETFSKDEIKRFGKFIASPYFNNGRNFTPFYRILKKHHPEFLGDDLSEENLFRRLNPGKKFDSKKSSQTIRVMYSDVTKLAKKFIAYDRLENGESEYEFKKNLSFAYYNKKMFNDFLNILNELSNALDKSDNKNDAYYQEKININRMITTALFLLDRESECYAYEKDNLLFCYASFFTNMQTYLNNCFVEKYNSNQPVKGFEMVKSFINNFDLDLFEKDFKEDEFGIKSIILYQYYLIKSRSDESDSDSLLNALEIFYKLFEKDLRGTKENFFVSLHNRFIGRKEMDRIYTVKANELFDFVCSQGLSKLNGSDYININIYHTALKHKEYLLTSEEFKSFIENSCEMILPEYKHDMRDYSMARYFFKIKSFDRCLELISKNDALGFHYTMDKYKLKVCSFYEKELLEDALYTVDAFEHFIRRKEIGLQIRKNSIDFIKAIRKLINLKLGQNTENINTNEIRETNKFSLFGDWFTEKVNELETEAIRKENSPPM